MTSNVQNPLSTVISSSSNPRSSAITPRSNAITPRSITLRSSTPRSNTIVANAQASSGAAFIPATLTLVHSTHVLITFALLSLIFVHVQPASAGAASTSMTGSAITSVGTDIGAQSASTPDGFHITDTCTDTVESGGSLQDAINDAETGDVICIGTGTFSGPVQVGTPGLTLRAADGAEPVISGGANGITIDGADGAVIHGIEIRDVSNDGVKVENSARVSITGSTLKNNPNAVYARNAPGLHLADNHIVEQRNLFRRGFGVDIAGSDSVRIQQNTFHQNPSAGILLADSRHGVIEGNGFTDHNGPAIHLSSADTITVTGNNIADGNTYGIRLETSIGVTIDDNTISGNRLYGILLEDESGQAQILANTLSGHQADIYLEESPFATITGNTMEAGIVIDPNNIRFDFTAGRNHFDHTMTGNTVAGGPLFYGNNVTAGDIPADARQVIIHNSDGLELTGLSFSDVAIGLIISHSDDVTLTDITAEDHLFDGVLVIVSERTRVVDSQFNNNGGNGIFLESSPGSMVLQSSATGNASSGMVFFWSHDSTFDGNTVTGNGEEGIYHWNSYDGTVTGNNAVENRTGISVTGAHRTSVTDNTATHNTQTGITVGNVRRPQIHDNIAMYNGGNGMATATLEFTGAITGNVSTHNQRDGIVLGTFRTSSSTITVQDNDFSSNERHGVFFDGSRDMILTENRILENAGHGILISPFTDNATISENIIANNAQIGIEMENGLADRSKIEGNVISGHTVDIRMNDMRRRQQINDNEMETGILVTGNRIENFDAFMSGNTVGGRPLFYSRMESAPVISSDAGQVIIHRGGFIEIDDMEFENVAAGVQVGFSDTLIVRNTTISGAQVGLNATGTELVHIEENTFSGNETGVLLQGTHAPEVFENNEFLANTLGLDVRGLSPTADARNNWWGSASGPSGGVTDPETGTVAEGSGDAIAGATRFDPWLGQGTIPTRAGDDDGAPDGDGRVEPELPVAFGLAQNYPNPFNPSTQISFSIPEQAHVRLAVYDLLGREIAVLVDQVREPGSYQAGFDAPGLSSGIYLYRLDAGGFAFTRRMTLVK